MDLSRFPTHLVSPGVQVHDQVLGLWVPVAHLALVAVRVPRHLLRLVLVLPEEEGEVLTYK